MRNAVFSKSAECGVSPFTLFCKSTTSTFERRIDKIPQGAKLLLFPRPWVLIKLLHERAREVCIGKEWQPVILKLVKHFQTTKLHTSHNLCFIDLQISYREKKLNFQ